MFTVPLLIPPKRNVPAIRIANTDYSLALFVYDLDGNFVSYTDNVSDTVLLDHDNYKYRLRDEIWCNSKDYGIDSNKFSCDEGTLMEPLNYDNKINKKKLV